MPRFECKIIEIQGDATDVKVFRLNHPGFDYIPGQYCTLSFPDGHRLEGERRPFTFSSSPTKKDYIEITVKLMGEFTKEMFKLSAGDKLIIFGPRDSDLAYDNRLLKIGYIAGGSGVTPFVSHIRFMKDKGLDKDVILFCSNKTKKDIIFRKELESCCKVVNNLTSDAEEWDGEKGRIDAAMVSRHVKASEYAWYVCGPPGLVSTADSVLRSLGAIDIRKEDWELPGRGDNA